MPLSDFWGAEVDRSVAGQVTVTLLGVTASGATDKEAARNWTDAAWQSGEFSESDLWHRRYFLALCAWKVDAYDALWRGSSGALKQRYRTRLDTWQALLPVAKAEAGE